jgi:putative transposase
MAVVTRHVVERAIDDHPCFVGDDDYLVYLDCLREGAERYRCRIHAYGLMADQVRMLVSADSEIRLSRMIRHVRSRYLEYVNYIHQGNGAFREGRIESVAIDSERDLLGCYRFVESCPVQEGMAVSPANHAWSSYNYHANGAEDPVIQDHPAYFGTGTNAHERQLAYRDSFRQSADDRCPAGIENFMPRAAVARLGGSALVH